jgi:hypothetical protein
MAVGDPTGAFLCSDTLGADVGNLTFDQGSSITLQSGKQYAFVITSTGLDAVNNVGVPQKVGGGYSGGLKCISSDAGSSWTQVGTRDLRFHIYDSTDTLQDNWTLFDAFQYVYGNYHVAQTFTAQATYVIKSIVLAFVYQGDLGTIQSGTLTCGIKEVEGEEYEDLPGEDPPGKAQNPTPSDGTENIKIAGISRIKRLQWEAPS